MDENQFGKSLNPLLLTDLSHHDTLLAQFLIGGYKGRSGKTVTRAQLGQAVYQEVGLSRNESAELLESVLAEMSLALARGETVKISSFGSFSVRQKGQRIGRNPKTGEEVPILPRKVLVFRPSQVLKSRINERMRPVVPPQE